MEVRMKESRTSSDKDSISSFSSDESLYKEKLEKERGEKYLKLLGKIESVANKCDENQSELKALLQEVERLKAEGGPVPGCISPEGNETQILTELRDSDLQRKTTKSSRGSSSSFEVIPPVNGPGLGDPTCPPLSQTSILTKRNSSNQQKQQDALTQYILNQSRERSQNKLSSQTSEPGKQPLSPAGQSPEIASCPGTSNPNRTKGSLPSSQTSSLDDRTSAIEATAAVAPLSARAALNTGLTHSSPNSSQNSTSQTTVRSPIISQSLPNVITTPPNTATMSAAQLNPMTDTLNKVEMAKRLAAIQQSLAGDAVKSDTTSAVQTVAASTSANTWGIGARPKDTNPFDWLPLNLTADLKSSANSTSELQQIAARDQSIVATPPASSLIPELEPTWNKFSINSTAENSALNPLSAHADTLTLNIPASQGPQTTLNVGEDLMTFPSLKSTPSPEKPAPAEDKKATEGHFVQQRHQVVAAPSDEHESQLASQAHSMMAQLQSGHMPTAAGMSDMLYKFAGTYAQMERKLMEYQSLIQRLQVQIQSYAQQNNNEELQRLRLQNKNLAALVSTRIEATSPETAAPGSVKVTSEKHQQATQPTPSASELKKKISDLTHTNEQLFKANKDWHNRWESLLQKARDEKQKLEADINSLSAEMENLKKESATLEQQLQEASTAKREAIQKNFDLSQEKLNQGRELESIKAQLDDAMRLKRKLEADISSLKQSQGNKETKTETSASGSGDPNTDLELLKQQLAVFHEDFQKEREDRSKAEGKMEKMRKERDAARMEQTNKMKKMHAMLSSKDDELSRKGKQLGGMQVQINSLRKELQKERRKSAQLLNSQQQTTAVQQQQHMLYPSGGPRSSVLPSGATRRNNTYPLASPQQPATQLSPEHVPNAWQCRECTFINFPERTVCDICGWQNPTANGELLTGGTDSATGVPELKSRGELAVGPLTDEPDVVTDTESDM